MSTERSGHIPRSSLWALARQRCPNCRRGIVYRRSSARNNLCPACGIKFEREPGYYTGAIYIGVIIAFPVVIVFIALLLYFFPSLEPQEAVLYSSFGLLPLLPVIQRISYVLWVALDRAIAKDDPDAPPPPDPAPTEPGLPPHPGGGSNPIPTGQERHEALLSQDLHVDAH